MHFSSEHNQLTEYVKVKCIAILGTFFSFVRQKVTVIVCVIMYCTGLKPYNTQMPATKQEKFLLVTMVTKNCEVTSKMAHDLFHDARPERII